MALSVQQFLERHQCAATCTIFPMVKQTLEGHHFADTEPIQVAVTQQLMDILECAFEKRFQNLERCWNCVLIPKDII